MSEDLLSRLDGITMSIDSRMPIVRTGILELGMSEETRTAVGMVARAAFVIGYQAGATDCGAFSEEANHPLECPRCATSSLRWTHSSWQCGHCRFKQGCCEGSG